MILEIFARPLDPPTYSTMLPVSPLTTDMPESVVATRAKTPIRMELSSFGWAPYQTVRTSKTIQVRFFNKNLKNISEFFPGKLYRKRVTARPHAIKGNRVSEDTY